MRGTPILSDKMLRNPISVLFLLTLIYPVWSDYENPDGQQILNLHIEVDDGDAEAMNAAKEAREISAETPETSEMSVAPRVPRVPRGDVKWDQDSDGKGKKLENTLLLIQKFQKQELDNSFDMPRKSLLPEVKSVPEEQSLKFADERRSRHAPQKLEAKALKVADERRSQQDSQGTKEKSRGSSFLDRVRETTQNPPPKKDPEPVVPRNRMEEDADGDKAQDTQVKNLVY